MDKDTLISLFYIVVGLAGLAYTIDYILWMKYFNQYCEKHRGEEFPSVRFGEGFRLWRAMRTK